MLLISQTTPGTASAIVYNQKELMQEFGLKHSVTRSLSSDASDLRVVLYDGVCNLCNASARFIINRDPKGRYRFAHLQSQTGKNLAKQHGIEPSTTDSFVLIAHNQALIKSDAWLSILESLGGIWQTTRVFRLVPRPMRDAVYDVVGRLRYRVFGKTTYCQTPHPDAYKRFLDPEELPERTQR